jgi:hypothetical protein
LLRVSRNFMNVANGVLWRMAIILKAKKVNFYLLFCLVSGNIHRTFKTHHVCGTNYKLLTFVSVILVFWFNSKFLFK